MHCLSNADCGVQPLSPPQICDAATGTCVGCLSDADCTGQLFSPGTHCSPSTRTCVECLSDGQCATGHCSAQNLCVCLSDADCGGGGRACHTQNGVCDDCATDAQCTAPTLPHCGPSRFGVKVCGECTTNAQCSGGTHCLDMICTTKDCFMNDDCGSIDVCDSSGHCVMP